MKEKLCKPNQHRGIHSFMEQYTLLIKVDYLISKPKATKLVDGNVTTTHKK